MGDESLDIQAFAKGINELLVLAVLRDGPKHGYQIALSLEQRSGGLFSLRHGTLYPILHRLEGEGRIQGEWSRGGGRRRKVYALTDSGRRRFAEDSARCHEVFGELLSIVEGGGRGDAIRDGSAEGRKRA